MTFAGDRMLEVQLVDALTRADWTWARAAACPWWAPVRRVLLVRRARGLERAADHYLLALATGTLGTGARV